ncbi:MAG: hypothetical protein AAGE52_16045 [Myxococcota bacterium]
MKFFVYSRPAIERVPAHDVPHIVISITTTSDDRARIPESKEQRGLLRLSFPDADSVIPGYEERDLFSEIHADAIWEFVLRHRADISRIALHCDAGMSRSPGVAAALSKVLVGNDAQFFKRYHPNMRVYRTLLERYYEKFER